ncbi:MAG TPA: hypothetical protein VI111_01635, partial [Thermoleophilaceae bacterium]
AKRLGLGKLRRGAALTTSLHVLRPGRLTLTLSAKPLTQANAARRRTVVIARGALVAESAGTRTLGVRLTERGRRILRGRRHIAVRAQLRFSAPNAQPISELARMRLGG